MKKVRTTLKLLTYVFIPGIILVVAGLNCFDYLMGVDKNLLILKVPLFLVLYALIVGGICGLVMIKRQLAPAKIIVLAIIAVFFQHYIKDLLAGVFGGSVLTIDLLFLVFVEGILIGGIYFYRKTVSRKLKV